MRRHVLGRILGALFALLAAGSLAACSSSAPPRTYAPLTYDYLTPLRLNVASVTVDPRVFTVPANDVAYMAPTPPVQALTQMAHDRLQAVGSSGRAVFAIKNATITRKGDTLAGTLDVELVIYGDGGNRAGFAQARVARQKTGDIDDLRSALYDMTKQMMDLMNVEFEYQVRRNLKDWLVSGNAAPTPVQQQNLAPPPGAAAAPAPAPSAPALSAPAPAAGAPASPAAAAPPNRTPPPSILGTIPAGSVPAPTPLLPPRQP